VVFNTFKYAFELKIMVKVYKCVLAKCYRKYVIMVRWLLMATSTRQRNYKTLKIVFGIGIDIA
jgi:hypothetical protein